LIREEKEWTSKKKQVRKQIGQFMRKIWIHILSLIIFSMPTVVGAGDDTSDEFWGDITTIYNFENRWQYNGDQGYRTAFSGNKFHLFYFRPSFSYLVKPGVTLHGGVGFFKSVVTDDADIFELRPWQGLRFLWPHVKVWTISHFFRLEQRLLWLKKPVDDFNSTVRARYQLGVVSPTYNILFDNGIFLTGSVEYFWNMKDSFTDNFSDRIRSHVGVGSQVSDDWRVEFQYVV
jgi:hypothetical protein